MVRYWEVRLSTPSPHSWNDNRSQTHNNRSNSKGHLSWMNYEIINTSQITAKATVKENVTSYLHFTALSAPSSRPANRPMIVERVPWNPRKSQIVSRCNESNALLRSTKAANIPCPNSRTCFPSSQSYWLPSINRSSKWLWMQIRSRCVSTLDSV